MEDTSEGGISELATPVKEEVQSNLDAAEGAKIDEKNRKQGHQHKLMNIHLELLEISHLTIEKIEKERYKILRKDLTEDEAVNEFKEFVWKQLLLTKSR